MSVERGFCTDKAHVHAAVRSLGHVGGAVSSDTVPFRPISSRDRKHMNRDEAAAKWNCSAGTIDKYAS